MKKRVRINQIIDLCEKETVIADIGTDHGYTSLALLKQGIAEKVIATDISENSIKKAFNLFQKEGFGSRAECRMGDGISVLRPREAQGIIISGMGGHLILHILKESPEVVQHTKWIIISPQRDLYTVRCELQNMHLRIVEEDVVQETAKFYPILKLKPGETEYYSKSELYTGKPELMHNKKYFLNYMKYLMLQQEKLLEKVSESKKIQQLKEMLDIYRNVRF